MLPYQPLSKLKYSKQGLIDFFYNNKESLLRPYTHKDKTWPFFVMSPLPYDQYSDILKKLVDIECRGYEFVYMPCGYEMDIHKDNYNLGSRIGILLEGQAGLDFFDNDLNPTVSFDYSLPALFDIRTNHNVTNTDSDWRLSFFINFNDTYDITLEKFRDLI